jgi:hypothetical protein
VQLVEHPERQVGILTVAGSDGARVEPRVAQRCGHDLAELTTWCREDHPSPLPVRSFGQPSPEQVIRDEPTRRIVGGMAARKNHGASIGDDEVYEKVRDTGASKEKAARIANAAANTSRKQVSRKGGQAGSYDDWTVAQLRKRAAELDIRGRSSMKRAHLVRALRNG